VALVEVVAKVLIVLVVVARPGVMNRVQTDRGLLVMMVLLVLVLSLVQITSVLFLVVIMVSVFVLIAYIQQMVIGMSIGVVYLRLR
jgi:hypothetical protein